MAALLDDGHSVGYFSSQESIRFAREIQRSYRDLNARIAERIVESCQESELQRQARRSELGFYMLVFNSKKVDALETRVRELEGTVRQLVAASERRRVDIVLADEISKECIDYLANVLDEHRARLHAVEKFFKG